LLNYTNPARKLQHSSFNIRPTATRHVRSTDPLCTHIALWVDSNFICYLMRAYFSRTLPSSLRVLCVTSDLHTVIPRWTSAKHVRCSPVQPPYHLNIAPVCHSQHPAPYRVVLHFIFRDTM